MPQDKEAPSQTHSLLTLSDLSRVSKEIYDKLQIQCEWQTVYELAFLKRNDKPLPDVVKELLVMRSKCPDKYKQLLVSIKLQLGQREVLANDKRVKPWKTTKDVNNEIYEFKSSAGLGLRLFFFFHNDHAIVCTNAWVKDNEKNKKMQTRQFEQASRDRVQFLSQFEKT